MSNDLNELKKVYSYMASKYPDIKYDPRRLMKIIVRSELNGKDVLGEVDYQTLDITNFKRNTIDKDLLFDIFVDRDVYTEMHEEMISDPIYSSPKFLTPIDVFSKDEDGNMIHDLIKVYGFKNDAEYYDTSINKALRVMTQYGIGYIGLVENDPDDPNPYASDFKICLGYTKYGHPIIRCLELVEPRNKKEG